MERSTGDTHADQIEYLTSRADLRLRGAWPASERRAGGDVLLIADGFNSTSTSAQRYIDEICRRCPAVEGRIAVQGFSYNGPGEQYGKLDTWDGFEDYIAFFTDHLPEGGCRLTAVGFSMGGLISLLGSAALSRPEVDIAAVILIAPFHNESSSLLTGYQQGALLRSLDVGNPPRAAEELCGADPRWRDRLRAAYTSLISRGTHVHIIWSEDDVFAASHQPDVASSDSRHLHYHAIRVMARHGPAPRPSAGAEVRFHLRVRTADQTLGAICSAVQNQ